MAKKPRKIKTAKGLRLKIVNPDSAGIDIADGEMQVCVPEDRDGDNNRRFGSFTEDLIEICEWLRVCRINTVAMEATRRLLDTSVSQAEGLWLRCDSSKSHAGQELHAGQDRCR